MNNPDMAPGSDALMGSILLAATLFFSVFKLGDLLARPKSAGRPVRPPCGQDQNGQLIFTDPDGRVAARSCPRD